LFKFHSTSSSMAAAVAPLPSDGAGCRKMLRLWREENVRRSADVVHMWQETLETAPEAALADELWMVIEQVCVAALDVHKLDVADQCLQRLRGQFGPESLRVQRLEGLRLEASEDWSGALDIYEQILQEDDANSAARKRKVAIWRQRGEIGRAVAELNRYLRDFMSDTEAWMELCELYLREQDYAKAAFCCEELILHNPNNHVYFQRYADVRYTQGGYENLDLAKSYYSKAVALNPDNVRALYGLLLTSSQLANSPKCQVAKKREHLKTVLWAGKQVTQRYEELKIPTSFLDGLMGQLQVQARESL